MNATPITYRQAAKAQVEIRKIEAILKSDRFDKLVANLQDLLFQQWDKQTRRAIGEMITALKHEGRFTPKDLKAIVEGAKVWLGKVLAGEVRKPLMEIQAEAYGLAAEQVIGANLTFQMVDKEAMDWLEKHNVYWVRNYYDRQIQDKVTELGQKVIREGLSRRKAAKLFQNAFNRRFQQESYRYWEGFSNHCVTRSREFGRVAAYERAGAKWLQVKAIIDHRTSSICRHMHNKVFSVADAKKTRNKMMQAQTPEDVLKIAPWMKPAQVIGKPATELPSYMSLPPYHYSCRSRTVVSNDEEARVQHQHDEDVARLHRDEEFKEMAEEFRSIPDDEQPFDRRLDFDSTAAVWGYTNRDYKLHRRINEDLAKKNELNAFQKSHARVLQGALEKMPKKKGTYYRGIKLSRSEKDIYQVGAEVPWNYFISTSADKGYQRNTMFEIIDGQGASIRHLSKQPGDNEFLILPGTTFEVLERNIDGNTLYITMKQVKTTSQVFKMTDRMADFIQGHKEALARFEALPPEERRKEKKRRQGLIERMQIHGTPVDISDQEESE